MISTRKGKPPPPRKKSKTIITAIPCWCLAILCVWTIISQWFYYHSTYNNNCPIDEKDICFVTCIFGDSVDQVDHPANVEWFANHWCNTRFFLVTNLPTLPAPGWTMLQLSSSPLKNKDAVVSQDEYIVQSRYAKFLGWKVLPISGCQTVIYMDGYLQPKYFTYQKFQTISRSLQGSYWGLSQVKQKYFNGLTMETILNNLVKDGKDTVEHVHTTLAWFQAQEDYQNGMTYYLNKYFGTCFCMDILGVYIFFLSFGPCLL